MKRGRSELLARLKHIVGSSRVYGLWLLLRDAKIMRMNMKNFGYQMAREMTPALRSIKPIGQPAPQALVSKPTTQSDVESAWFAHWCHELRIEPIYHRKLWEFAFALQCLFDHGLLKPGAKGIGFGCGEEPLASYFASRRMDVTVTDLAPDRVRSMGWVETGQHATTLDKAWIPDLVPRPSFDAHVRHDYVDMNAIPDLPPDFDFCWSICALEHLGSIENGLRFVENSLKVLKPGGLAVHTTEFNYLSESRTLDRGNTVLFLRRHFESLGAKLASQGHRMLGPDFDVGDGPVDRYVDIAPYSFAESTWLTLQSWGGVNGFAHLKLALGGYPSTCYGIVVVKAGQAAGN